MTFVMHSPPISFVPVFRVTFPVHLSSISSSCLVYFVFLDLISLAIYEEAYKWQC
jgi:hypothetical protein